MVGSICRRLAGLTCLWLAAAVAATRAADGPSQSPPRPAGATPPAPGSDSARAERARNYGLPGEDPPQLFVPLHPRTTEDRARVEALTEYCTARALEDRRDWTAAIRLYEQALKREPESITILRRLSRLNFILGRTDPGIQYSKRVLAVAPGDSETITRLVNHYNNRKNDPAAAESLLKDVLASPRLDPRSGGRLVALRELGKLYASKLKNAEKAAEAYAKVIELLDDKAANRLSPADQARVLGTDESAAYEEFGLVFLEAKKYELAIKAFERGLDYDPDDPELPLHLARSLHQTGRDDRALGVVERFLKRQPQGIEGYELQAQVLTALKRDGEITPRLEAAAKKDSKNVALQYVLADRYRETGQVDKAEALYKALVAAQPTTQGYGALATSLLKRKKAEDLIKVITEAVIRPGGSEAVQETVKGIIADPALADQVLDAGAKLLSTDPPGLARQAVTVLAVIATGSKKLEKFLPVQRLELKRHPSPQTYRELALVLVNLHRYGEAATTIDEMFTRYPSERNTRNLSDLVRFYRLSDQPAAAIKAAREALKLDPNDLDAQVQLAIVLSQTGQGDEAVSMLRDALKKEPNNPQLGSVLGSILSQLGRNDQAMTLFKGLLEKFPGNEEVVKTARQNLSVIYVNMGDYARGEAELEALLEKSPDEPGVNNDLGYLYADQGKNLEKAEAMIRKAVQEEPDNSAYLDSLGWVLFKRGKVKEAVEPLEKAVQKMGETAGTDATVLEHLGDVYFQLQEVVKAKSSWQSAEKAALKATPPDKRLPEIRKKLGSLEKLGQDPRPATGRTP
jgi:tetratricopeptide (TPR) repeat protein